MELKKYICGEEKNIRVHGRISGGKSPVIPLFWTASAVEFNITGSELWIEYTCYNIEGGMNLRVEIDKFEMYRFSLEEGTHKIRIMQRFGANDIKNVRIFREMQANGTQVTIDALYTDGTLMPLPERKYKIEVYGDSVTSGEGLAGDRSLMHWIPAVFSTRGNYALRVADALDADWSIVSQSGWGVFTDWCGNMDNAIPNVYDRVCGPAKNQIATELGSQEPYDFSADKTNISIVNLGANDSSAFGKELRDSEGNTRLLRYPEDLGVIVDAVYNFIGKIRKTRKDSLIIWCYNMLNDRLNDSIIDGVDRFISETGDKNVFTVMIPRAPESARGSRNHPGADAHAIYADAILTKLGEILK